MDQVELPAADRPTAAEEKALASCASVDFYYGLGAPADPVKARKCAYAEMDRGTKPGLTGKAILATDRPAPRVIKDQTAANTP